MQRIAGHREHSRKHEGVDNDCEGDGVQDHAEPLVWVDAVKEHDERELGQGGWPEIAHAQEEQHLWRDGVVSSLSSSYCRPLLFARGPPCSVLGRNFTHIFVTVEAFLCDAPQMLTKPTGHDLDHADEGGEIYGP